MYRLFYLALQCTKFQANLTFTSYCLVSYSVMSDIFYFRCLARLRFTQADVLSMTIANTNNNTLKDYKLDDKLLCSQHSTIRLQIEGYSAVGSQIWLHMILLVCYITMFSYFMWISLYTYAFVIQCGRFQCSTCSSASISRPDRICVQTLKRLYILVWFHWSC